MPAKPLNRIRLPNLGGDFPLSSKASPENPQRRFSLRKSRGIGATDIDRPIHSDKARPSGSAISSNIFFMLLDRPQVGEKYIRPELPSDRRRPGAVHRDPSALSQIRSGTWKERHIGLQARRFPGIANNL